MNSNTVNGTIRGTLGQFVGHLESSWDTLKLEFLIDYPSDLAEILCAFRIQGEEATHKISAKSDNPFLRYGCPTFSSGVPRIVPLTVLKRESATINLCDLPNLESIE